MKLSRWKKVLLSLGLIFIVGVVGFIIWASDSYQPMQEALDAMKSDDIVEIEQGEWIVFKPKTVEYTKGFIFYPGGKVSPESYAPLARAIATAGYIAIIVPMPLNLAVFSPNKAENVIAEYSAVKEWVIGGHSLGGSMVASFIYNHVALTAKLVLLAAYPANNNDLSDYNIQVVSIYGSEDGLLDDSIDNTKSLLPAGTVFIEIEGGNHAYFGYYGEQSGDNPATITREQQQ
jgi:hypothetical protein